MGLRGVGAEPVLVFDGGRLPAKQVTEQARNQAREAARWKAAALIGGGVSCTASETSAKLLSGAVDITPEMAAACIRRMQVQGVECIVAPCEADAQLAHLSLSGRVDVCTSLDVDLLAFGCARVLFGLDIKSGCGREVRLADLSNCRGLAPYRLSAETLPDLCVLGGCDYLPSLPRVGLRTAAQLLHRSGGSVRRALQLMRREGIVVPEEYGRQVAEARLVFSCQVIYNDSARCLQPLRPLPPSASAEGSAMKRCQELLGLTLYSDAVAREIAEGRMNPITGKPFRSSILAVCECEAKAQTGSSLAPQRDVADQCVAREDVSRPRETSEWSDTLTQLSSQTSASVVDEESLARPPASPAGVASQFRRPRPAQAAAEVAEQVPAKRRRLGCRPSL